MGVMDFMVVSFGQLSAAQLYDIMALRAKVFVVEQQSIYLDPDGYDQAAQHILCVRDGVLAAYARIIAPGGKYAEPSIGRIVTAQEFRGQGLGEAILEFGIAYIREAYPGIPIRIEAQQYLKRFYEKAGFVQVSQPYDLDGIIHVEMVLECAP